MSSPRTGVAFHATSRQTTKASIASPRPFHGRPVDAAAPSTSRARRRNPASSSVAFGAP
jgi:hypothetical protein